jgi:hypothetical protein
MSTAIATPATAAPEVEVSAELWRSYRRLRALHKQERPSRAADLALTECGFTKSDSRGRLERLLVEREQSTGLSPTPGERREDEALEAEAAVAEPDPPEPGSLEAVRADAARSVVELEEAKARLAPEAIAGDPDVLAELRLIEGELAHARATSELSHLAEGETARRAREASEAAARAAAEAAEAEAQALQPQIRKAAERLDVQASTFAECAVAFQELKEAQAGAVGRTRRGQEAVRGRRFRRREVAAALFVALRERGLGGVIEGFEGSNRDTPLAAGEPEQM